MIDPALKFTAGLSLGEAREARNEQLHNSWIVAAMLDNRAACLTLAGVRQVPTNLVMDAAFHTAPEEAFVEALLATNEQLHHSQIDDAMSGTTAIAALVRGRTLYVANVGDSRCVLAERAHGGRLVAVPLSFDHTPFRQALPLSPPPGASIALTPLSGTGAALVHAPAACLTRAWRAPGGRREAGPLTRNHTRASGRLPTPVSRPTGRHESGLQIRPCARLRWQKPQQAVWLHSPAR